jgi:hypothetical protein
MALRKSGDERSRCKGTDTTYTPAKPAQSPRSDRVPSFCLRSEGEPVATAGMPRHRVVTRFSPGPVPSDGRGAVCALATPQPFGQPPSERRAKSWDCVSLSPFYPAREGARDPARWRLLIQRPWPRCRLRRMAAQWAERRSDRSDCYAISLRADRRSVTVANADRASERGDREAENAALEMPCGVTATAGSNPVLYA